MQVLYTLIMVVYLQIQFIFIFIYAFVSQTVQHFKVTDFKYDRGENSVSNQR